MATKRPADQCAADSDESCPGPSKQARVEDNPSSSSSDEASAGGSDLEWPIVFSGNEVVWHDSSHNWLLDVKKIVLDGVLECSFRMVMNCAVSVGFGTQSQYVEVNEIPLSTTNSDQANFSLRAHLLINECSRLRCYRPCHIIMQYVRPATSGDPDSDDEQVPDPEVPPAFTSEELAVVNYTYRNDLWQWFHKAYSKHFQNAQGKHFFVALGKFLVHVHPLGLQECYMSTCSTNPQGPAQPGNMELIITDAPRESRRGTKPVKKYQKRVADYVLYDVRNNMYAIVGEIKSDASTGEGQNVEQMVGLFRKNQQAMLGFTCNTSAIIPRILVHREGTLVLHTLVPLPLDEDTYSESLCQIAQLFMAFISIVNIAQN